MASHRICLRTTFLCLIASAVVFVITITYQGAVEPSLHGSWRYGFLITDTNQTNSSSPQERRLCNHKAMSSILLVIAFTDDTSNHEIPVLEALYRKHFPNILYCGPAEAQTGSEHEILVAEVLHGVTAYSCMAGAMDRYPSYEGYLFIRSNMFVNYWRLAELDRAHIWQTEILGSQAMFEQSRESWVWWYTPWGLRACENVYKRLISLNAAEKTIKTSRTKDTTSKLSWDVHNALNALLWNGRGNYKCYHGNANIFYIPGKYSTTFKQMAKIFEEFQVYMDIAVPMMIQMLELEDKVVRLSGVDIGELYGEKRSVLDTGLFWKHLNSTAAYIRPLGIAAKYKSRSGVYGYKEVMTVLLDRLYNDEQCTDDEEKNNKDTSYRSSSSFKNQ